MSSSTQSGNEASPLSYQRGRARTGRPFGVTLLALVVLVTAIINLTRFWQGITQWEFLAQVLPFSPIYLVLSGILWGLAGLPIFWGLWRGLAWAPGITGIGLSSYLLYYWADRLFMPGYEGRNLNWMFALGVHVFFMGLFLWVLTRPRAKLFFGGKDE